MRKKFDVIGLGSDAIDQVIHLAHPLTANSQTVYLPQNPLLFAGGAVGNALTALARLELKTGYLGKIGGDRFGIMLKQAAVAEGIDLSHCEIIPHANSVYTWNILTPEGIRTTICFPNLLTEIDEAYIQANAAYIHSCRLLHLEASQIPLPSLLAAVEIAKAEDIPVSFSLNASKAIIIDELHLGTPEELDTLISFCDLFFLTLENAGPFIDNPEAAEDAAAYLREKYLIPYVIIAEGTKGWTAATEEENFFYPAFDLERLDRSGADDAFQAGMMFGFLQEWDIRQMLRFGNACHALTSLKVGPRPGMPSRSEVEQFLAKGKEDL